MLCKNPFIKDGRAYGCNQCMPCRLNKRRVWAHRILLEANLYEANCFATLTYRLDQRSLDPVHPQKWLKRLRDRIYPNKIRFFLVGEYGDATFRPHYHAALFGFPTCEFGQSTYSLRRSSCCAQCDLVRDTWALGHIYLGSLQRESASYLAGYVTKKMTSEGDPRLEGRHPEFARMSLRPGVGGDALWEVADALLKHDLDVKLPDVPATLRHGPKEMPVGRYLQRRLRTLIGKAPHAPQVVMDKIDAEMLPLRMAAKNSEDNPSLKSRVVEKYAGKVQQVEARARIFKKPRGL